MPVQRAARGLWTAVSTELEQKAVKVRLNLAGTARAQVLATRHILHPAASLVEVRQVVIPYQKPATALHSMALPQASQLASPRRSLPGYRILPGPSTRLPDLRQGSRAGRRAARPPTYLGAAVKLVKCSGPLVLELRRTHRLRLQQPAAPQLRERHRAPNSPFSRSIESALRIENVERQLAMGSLMYRNLLLQLAPSQGGDLRPGGVRRRPVEGLSRVPSPPPSRLLSFAAPAPLTPLVPLQSLVPAAPPWDICLFETRYQGFPTYNSWFAVDKHRFLAGTSHNSIDHHTLALLTVASGRLAVQIHCGRAIPSRVDARQHLCQLPSRIVPITAGLSASPSIHLEVGQAGVVGQNAGPSEDRHVFPFICGAEALSACDGGIAAMYMVVRNARGQGKALPREPPGSLMTPHDSRVRESYRGDPALISSLIALHRVFSSLAM
ncbi:hypothetical protein TgHK011_000518 [Trichoderma gracile]|nr:hypothetical protein TgHK011_000518 [Trichoderma gracile]